MLHEVKDHRSLLLYNCNECKEWFTNREHLIRHKKQHRSQYYLCVNCEHIFENAYELEYHILLHTEQTHNCEYCPMSFLKPTELLRHTKKRHRNDPPPKKGVLERYDVVIQPIEGQEGAMPVAGPKPFTGYQRKDLIQPVPPPEQEQDERPIIATHNVSELIIDQSFASGLGGHSLLDNTFGTSAYVNDSTMYDAHELYNGDHQSVAHYEEYIYVNDDDSHPEAMDCNGHAQEDSNGSFEIDHHSAHLHNGDYEQHHWDDGRLFYGYKIDQAYFNDPKLLNQPLVVIEDCRQ